MTLRSPPEWGRRRVVSVEFCTAWLIAAITCSGVSEGSKSICILPGVTPAVPPTVSLNSNRDTPAVMALFTVNESPSTIRVGSLTCTIGAPPASPSILTPSTVSSTLVISIKKSFSKVTRLPTAVATIVVVLSAVIAATNAPAKAVALVPGPKSIC